MSNDGAISGNDNDADTLAFEPHYDEMTSSEQVQIYKAIVQDAYGNVTTVLLSASAQSESNRLLPTGFDKTAAATDVAPQGKALTDDDFVGGMATVAYRVDTGDAIGLSTVEVELLYQTIAYLWAQDVSTHDTEQAKPSVPTTTPCRTNRSSWLFGACGADSYPTSRHSRATRAYLLFR